MIKFTVPGEPKSKGRARFQRIGNFVKTYTPTETVAYENWVKMCYMESKSEKMDGQLGVNIISYYNIPKSMSNKKREEAIIGRLRPTKKPDVDNVSKVILDSLNKIAYHDDSSVVELTTVKYYGEDPRVEVEIYEV